MQKIKNGEFDDNDLETIKKQLYKDFQLGNENFKNKALLIGQAFSKNQSLADIFTYVEKLEKISKEDIIAVANKYYSDNYLAFYSKMGFPKKSKIEKPGYEPLISNTDAKSKFREELEKIPTLDQKSNFIDFNKDIKRSQIHNHQVFVVNNPYNDVFSLNIKYG